MVKNNVLVINAGSSSIKFSLYTVENAPLARLVDVFAGQIEGINGQPRFIVSRPDGTVWENCCLTGREVSCHTTAIQHIFAWIGGHFSEGELLAVGHRIVHGGQRHLTPVLMNASILADLECLVPLAPLHQSHNLAAVRALQKLMPLLPQVACFDTAFHCTQPEAAQRFAIPRQYTDQGIRRYGFHGLSYEYIASILPNFESALAEAKVIIAHLGSGASLCALHKGRSIATTMGFSPLDGLMMGTRCGSIDPGVLLYLMDHFNMDARQLEALLYYQSGLLGVSGISDDMRTLLASNEASAQEAIELFVYRIGREIGSLVAALGGVDALVFTGGIGEHSAFIREQVCCQAAWLGFALDKQANQAGAGRISLPDSKLSAWVVASDENLMIAQHTLRTIMVDGTG